MCSGHSKSKLLLQDWISESRILAIAEELLGSFGSPVSRKPDEISPPLQVSRLALIHLRRLRHLPDIRLSAKLWDFTVMLRLTLFYSSETWLVRAEETGRLSVFEHYCHLSSAKWWENFVSCSVVRRKVLGARTHCLEQALNQNRTRRLRHALCIPTECLSLRALLCETDSGWMMIRSGR